MPNNWILNVILCLFCCSFLIAQESESLNVELEKIPLKVKDTVKSKEINALAPSKAAFYSAILPGLGQAYNKKYWKVPIVMGAIGTGIIVYDFNSRKLNRFRDAYKRRLAGFTDDEFYGTDPDGNPLASPRISNEGLIRAQQDTRRDKDLTLLITIGLYALNIIDANVDAHLLQYNVDKNVTISNL